MLGYSPGVVAGDSSDRIHGVRKSEVSKRLQEQTVAAAKAADEAVREHPYQAIGIAFGVGVLIGVLVARNRRE